MTGQTMPIREYAGEQIEVDEEGFLVDPQEWSVAVARGIARDEGIRLTRSHWPLVALCREEGLRTGRTPRLDDLLAASGVSRSRLVALFETRPARALSRIAGLPAPCSRERCATVRPSANDMQ